MTKNYFVFLLIAMFVIAACKSPKAYDKKLSCIEDLMENYPDSAYHMLCEMKDSITCSNRNIALYCLLITKARDKTYRTLTSDSVINIALDYFKKEKDPFLLAESYFYAGRVSEEMENNRRAIAYYWEAINSLKRIENYKLLYLSYYYLGELYSEQELFEEELKMQKKSYYYALHLNDSLLVMYSLRAIGEAFSNLSMDNDALCFYKQALNWVSKTDSMELAYVYNALSATYNRLNCYELALRYVEKSENYQCDSEELPYIYVLKGHIYMNVNQYDSAYLYYNKSIISDNFYTRAASYKGLYDLEQKVGNYQKAIIYNESYLSYRDSIEAKMHSDAIIKLRHIYQNDKLRDENTELHLAKAELENRNYRISVIFVVILIGTFVIYYLCKLKKEHKIKEQRITILMNQERLYEIETQKIKKEKELIEQRHKELALREEFFKRMITLSVPILIKNKTETRIKLFESDWDKILENVDIAFDNFSKRLSLLYPKLTADDVRFCTLIKIGLSISDLSNIYCMEKTSIYKRKERIKKSKMNILDSRCLDEIICGF